MTTCVTCRAHSAVSKGCPHGVRSECPFGTHFHIPVAINQGHYLALRSCRTVVSRRTLVLIVTCLSRSVIEVTSWCLNTVSDCRFAIEWLVSSSQASCRHSACAPVAWLARVENILRLWFVVDISVEAVESWSTSHRGSHRDLVAI